MAKTVEVTELDFDEIKKNIINYMSSQEAFKDYDFTASGLNTLIDILATNTHINEGGRLEWFRPADLTFLLCICRIILFTI